MLYTLKDVGDWCIEHGKQTVFKTYTNEQIYSAIIGAAKSNKLYLSEDKDGRLDGVMLATIYAGTKRLYVHSVLTIGQGYNTLVSEFYRRFPDYTATGLKLKTNTTRNLTLKTLWEINHRRQQNPRLQCFKHCSNTLQPR